MEKIVNIDRVDDLVSLFGEFDRNMKAIEKAFGVNIISRDGSLKLCGDDEENLYYAQKAVETLLYFIVRGDEITEQRLDYCIAMAREGSTEALKQLSGDCICITVSGKPIKPKTLGQKNYIEMISKNTVVFGIGPAGTGKTYLAVAMAVKAFKAQEVSRIILTRPAVEAGEKLGFLPGDLQTKVDPYLRPLYDALFDMFGAETFARHMEKGIIEVAPLAYMRGRTLDDSFIILDEAQNTTPEQMKMFLTRLGQNSKAVVTGDVTQIDLPDARKSGLVEASKVLRHVEGISIVHFSERDVVRNKIVQQIIKAYNKYYEEVKR